MSIKEALERKEVEHMAKLLKNNGELNSSIEWGGVGLIPKDRGIHSVVTLYKYIRT